MKRSGVGKATAPQFFVEVGRIIATGGNFLLRKWVGSGMMRLACKVSLLVQRVGSLIVSLDQFSRNCGQVPVIDCCGCFGFNHTDTHAA
jgi:hypothetical protein